jgi:hypothetical protein
VSATQNRPSCPLPQFDCVRVADDPLNDQQTLCDISLLILRLTSATPSPTRLSELAVFDARLYVRVRRIDEPA